MSLEGVIAYVYLDLHENILIIYVNWNLIWPNGVLINKNWEIKKFADKFENNKNVLFSLDVGYIVYLFGF